MRIGIDARLYGPAVGGGGLGRYVEQLVTELQTQDRENRYVLFLKPENFDACKLTAPNFEKRLADAHWYTAKEQLLMPRPRTPRPRSLSALERPAPSAHPVSRYHPRPDPARAAPKRESDHAASRNLLAKAPRLPRVASKRGPSLTRHRRGVRVYQDVAPTIFSKRLHQENLRGLRGRDETRRFEK